MKLYNLSASDTSPCIVLNFKTCSIMLDCALDFSTVYNFLPLTLTESPKLKSLPNWTLKNERGSPISLPELIECAGRAFVDAAPEFNFPEEDLIDLSTVDAILISNSVTMLALPFITEYCGFRGTVYATEPTLQIGRLLMEELIEYCHRMPKDTNHAEWKLPKYQKQLPSSLLGGNFNESEILSWRRYYSADDLQSAISKVQAVAYSEKISIFGALDVTAYSSGYSLGSCNWVIQSGFEKITYMSGCSSLTTHPQQLDDIPLSESDLLIFTGLTQAPTNSPDNMLAEFCSCIAKTIKDTGNVLIPCLPSGLLYDLLECLLAYMEQQDLIKIPIYLVSPSAKAALAFSQIFAEWLHPNKQNKVYLPEPPFPHSELLELGRLKVYSSIQDGLCADFKKPCIVFAGHPSLRFGDAVSFIELWGSSPSNSIIFVEPNFPHVQALAPFQPLAARTFHFPIDTRTDHKTSSHVLNRLKPRKLVVPTSYLKPPVAVPHRNDLRLNITECEAIPLELKSVVRIDVKSKYEKVHLTPDLAKSLLPVEVSSGVLAAPISALLSSKDNRHTLKPVLKQTMVGRKRKFRHEEVVHRPLPCGNINVNNFVNDLKQEGFSDVKVESSSGSGKIILLQDTVIQVDSDSTHIVCNGDDTLRAKLRDVFLKNLD